MNCEPHCRCPGCGVCEACIERPKLLKQIAELESRLAVFEPEPEVSVVFPAEPVRRGWMWRGRTRS